MKNINELATKLTNFQQDELGRECLKIPTLGYVDSIIQVKSIVKVCTGIIYGIDEKYINDVSLSDVCDTLRLATDIIMNIEEDIALLDKLKEHKK